MEDPAKSQPLSPYTARLQQWLARALLGALVLALLELPHVALFLPAATSDALGFGWYVLHLVCLFTLLGAPLAALAARFERRIDASLERTSPAWLLTLVIGAAVGVAFLERLHAYTGSGQARQFPERIDLLRTFVELGGILGLSVLCTTVVYRVVHTLLSHAPNLARPRVAVALGALGLVLTGVLAADFALFSIHLDELSVAITLGAVALLLLLMFCAWRAPSPRAQRAALGTTLALLLLEVVGPLRDPHALFLLHNHSPLGGPVMLYLGVATDLDRDGVAGAWLGGADCDDFDPKRSPTRRDAAGDGVDQDCSGADTRAQPPATPRVTPLLQGCNGVPHKPSIVLITIEALRADVIRPEVTPNLLRFAAHATRFQRAYTAAPFTIYSTLGLFTGQPITAVTNANPLRNNRYCAGESFTTTLAKSGYRTGEYCYVTALKVINDGFRDINYHPEPYDALPAELFGGESVLTSALLTRAAIRYVDEFGASPFFLWVHYLDTHAPYDGPPNYVAGVENTALTDYERTAAYVDHHVGRFIEHIVRSGLSNHTAIVITADHGEDLGQRGKEGHGPFLYEETIHVPLLAWIPGCPGRDVLAPVSLTQLGPSLAALGGARTAGTPLHLDADPAPPVVVESLSRDTLDERLVRAVVEPRYKLIVDVKNGGRMLFDLAEDPGETRDIYRAEPEVAKRLETSYRRWLDRPDYGWRPGCVPGHDNDGGAPARFGG